MSVQNEIDRIIGLVSDSHEKVKARGGETAEPYLLANLPGAIESIPKGVELPKLTNPASASDIVKGKEVIGSDGNVITGEVLAVNDFNTSMNASGMSVNGTDLVMTSHQYGSFMLNAGSDIVFKTPLNLFGDATAEDVAEGVIFTSEQGFRKTGTMKRGIDTSDATATASDMAEGVTAYVNGEKVTGTLTKAGTPLGNEMVVNVEGGAPYESGGYLVAYSDNPFAERQIVDEKIRINVLTDLEHLGDAAAADVVKGKFFTSVAGVMVEGTKEDSPATQAVVLVAEATPSANSLTLEFTGLSGEPTLFSIHPKENITLGSTRYILGVDYDGENTVGIQGYSSGSFMSSSATATYSATAFSWAYANGTLTVTSGSATTGGYFMNGITYQLVYITDTLTQGEVVGPSLDLSQVTVTEASMLDGVKAYDKTGKLIEGSIQSQAAQTITPKTTDQTIAAGKYLSGIQTIKGDSNLIAGNIKKGVSIFGVAGSYDGEGGSGSSVETFHVTSTTQTISPTKTGTVKVWGYGLKSTSNWSKTAYSFVGDGYYSGTTGTKTSATFTISNGVLSGLPSGLTAIDVLVTIGI